MNLRMPISIYLRVRVFRTAAALQSGQAKQTQELISRLYGCTVPTEADVCQGLF